MNDSESTSADAVQKVKESAEALQKAQADQIERSNRASEDRMVDLLTKTLKHALYAGDNDNNGQKRFIDVTRIPVICADIASIKDDIKWATRLIIGAVLLGLIGLLIPQFVTLIK